MAANHGIDIDHALKIIDGAKAGADAHKAQLDLPSSKEK